jgi:hypothetical protein
VKREVKKDQEETAREVRAEHEQETVSTPALTADDIRLLYARFGAVDSALSGIDEYLEECCSAYRELESALRRLHPREWDAAEKAWDGT